jgi:hypothetical protein
LILQIADLRDRDVGEHQVERLAHRADRHRLARRAGVGIVRGLGGDRCLFVLDGHEDQWEGSESLKISGKGT